MAFSISAFRLDEDDLPHGWMADRLDTLASLNPEQIGNRYPHAVIAYLDIANVTAGVVGRPVDVSVADAPSRAKRIVRPNDTILSTVRPGNRAYAFLRDAPDNLIVSTGFAVLRAKPAAADPRFLYYVVTSDPLIDYLASVAEEKTAYPSVNPSDIAECVVPIPPLSEQRAIAHILGILDDKIELNRRMNETLEAIARAIFKSWFVDFDPVRAKASGEAPESICRRLRLTPDLLALFPDRLVDSELGEIPEGWEVKPLDGIADYLNGLALQKFPPVNDSEWLPVIKISQLKKGDSVGADRASHKLKPEYIVDDGDVLFSWSGSLEVDIWCGGRGALNQHLFKVTSENYPKWFYFYWTKHHLSHFQAIAAGKAVTMGHIQRKHLTEALCAVPPKPLMEKLDGSIAPLLDKQIENRKETRTLGLVRDTLLPKLLSGELRVPEAEGFIERVESQITTNHTRSVL